MVIQLKDPIILPKVIPLTTIEDFLLIATIYNIKLYFDRCIVIYNWLIEWIKNFQLYWNKLMRTIQGKYYSYEEGTVIMIDS